MNTPGRPFWLLLATILSCFSARAVESHPLPASEPAGLLAAGTAFATPYYLQESGVVGPVVVITGGVHGDEPAGAYAADQIRHWPIRRGRLIILPRANVPALAADKRNTPGVDSTLANLNRNFPRAGASPEARGPLAEALWHFIQQQNPTWLIDLHEGSDFDQINPKSVGSTIITFPSAATKEIAPALLSAVNDTISEPSKRFVQRTMPIDGSLARAAGEHLAAHAMILETTRKDQPLSIRARQHRLMVYTLLRRLQMLDDAVTPDWIIDRAWRTPAGRRTCVAIYDAAGSAGQGIPRVTEQLGKSKNNVVLEIGPEEIRHDALAQFDVVMVTGGSAGRQASTIGDEGRAKIRQFIQDGGGYVGICAGAYLACDGFSWGLKILNAQTVSDKWKRGSGTVKFELTDRGRELFGNRFGQMEVHYANGPILEPAQSKTLPAYEPLAFFRTELAENGTPAGVMVNSPAAVAARYGQGRLICFSPHPEQSVTLEEFIPRAVAWVAKP